MFEWIKKHKAFFVYAIQLLSCVKNALTTIGHLQAKT